MKQRAARLAHLAVALTCLVGALSAQVDGDWELPRWAPGLIQVGPGSSTVGGAGAAAGSTVHANQAQKPPATSAIAPIRRLVVEPERTATRPVAPVDGTAGAFFVVLAGSDSSAPGLVLDSGVVAAGTRALVRLPAALGGASVLVVVATPDGTLTVTPWRLASARGEPGTDTDAGAASDVEGAPPAGTTLVK